MECSEIWSQLGITLTGAVWGSPRREERMNFSPPFPILQDVPDVSAWEETVIIRRLARLLLAGRSLGGLEAFSCPQITEGRNTFCHCFSLLRSASCTIYPPLSRLRVISPLSLPSSQKNVLPAFCFHLFFSFRVMVLYF